MDFLNPKTFALPEGEPDDAMKLAYLLRKVNVNGNAMDIGKAGTMMQGRLGYQFDPNQQGNNFGVGVSGQTVANNKYKIPSTINGLDLSYGGPNQSVSVGYYPNKSQFMGQPMGAGGVSLMYNKSFD